jgi:hypothetical protein
LKRGIPSLAIANNHEAYKNYHTQYDTIENVKVDSAEKTVRSCVEAVLALLKTKMKI